MGIFQPVGQKRLTNVAVVRFKKGGKRFEIACYRNKVQEWRTGVEKDLDEVLQSTTVFENVSKAKHANHKDLEQVFGTTDEEKICLEILQKGELQISDKEREQELGQQFRDVVSTIVEKCINPESNLPYTYGLIEKGLRNAGFSVDPKRSTKQQAIEAIPILKKSFPIERAKMRVKITLPLEHKDQLYQILNKFQPVIEYDELQNDLYILLTKADPGIYRELHTFFSKQLRGKGQMEVLTFVVQGEDTNKGLQDPTKATKQLKLEQDFQNKLVVNENQDQNINEKAQPTEDSELQKDNKVDQQQPSQVEQKPLQGQEQGQKQQQQSRSQQDEKVVVYPRGLIEDIPEQFQKRKEMFQEVEKYQQGWTVELHQGKNSNFVEAIFYNPEDQLVGPFNKARAQAIKHSKQ